MDQKEPCDKLPSPRQSKMEIDALLNPGDGDPKPRPQYVSNSHRRSYHQPSPSFPPSPKYWYNQGHESHGMSAKPHRSYPSFPPQQQAFASYHHQRTNPSSLSAPSSPGPYHSRERFSSVSSSSSTNDDRRRPPRPKYEEEEMYFIWYHRVDLCQEWKEVREAFNRQFPDRQRRGFQGIQCKFYRFIKEKKCPTLREQRRMRDGELMREGAATALADGGGAPNFGVRGYTNVWYPWMRKGDTDVMLRV
ncbi:hypothetical protein N7534_005685 [Penicillium rubens]|nr:hypothetical protein N7534_005685 [Penicillium rubens]